VFISEIKKNNLPLVYHDGEGLDLELSGYGTVPNNNVTCTFTAKDKNVSLNVGNMASQFKTTVRNKEVISALVQYVTQRSSAFRTDVACHRISIKV